MRVVVVDPDRPDAALLAAPAAALAGGELVVFPTETVYGLGANALDSVAVEAIFRAKGRPSTNPVIVHVADIAAARGLVREWPPLAEQLARRFWPGPLTLVLPRGDPVPDAVTAGADTVGIRMPAHPVARLLIALAGVPVAAPSANRYMGVSPTDAAHVGVQAAWLVDGGRCPVGIESTVLSLVGEPRVLRPGGVSVAEIREIVPNLPDYQSVIVEGAAPSPGMAARHYAPTARLSWGTEGEGSIRRGPIASGAPRVVLPDDPAGYAAGLYAALHELDALGVQTVGVEPLPEGPAWAAVRDRLTRAMS